MKCRANLSLALAAGLILIEGCASITAVNLNDPKAPDGIPYYLPKPYLFVSKNIRFIPTPTVGLTEVAAAPTSPGGNSTGNTNSPSTNSPQKSQQGSGQSGASGQATGNQPSPAAMSMDNSAGTDPLSDPGVRHYADHAGAAILADDTGEPTGQPSGGGTGSTGNSTNPQQNTPSSSQVTGPPSVTVVPAASVPDEMHPETFFTYQIVYLPDLTEKYGLRVKGGVGEMRQTMNLVNGWMYTGAGPTYLTNSTAAEDITSVGSAVGSVAEDIVKALVPGSASTSASVNSSNMEQQVVLPTTQRANGNAEFDDYAELYIYEPIIKVEPATKANSVSWKLIKKLTFSRQYVSTSVDSPPSK